MLTKLTLCFLLLMPTLLPAQGVRKDDTATQNSGGFLKVVPSAVITVCVSGTVTCTPSSSLASIFQDSALSVAQLNPFNADVNGNYGFWAASGNYVVSVSGTGVTTKQITYTLGSASGGGSAPGGITGDLQCNSGTLTFIGCGANVSGGILTVNEALTLSGANQLNVSQINLTGGGNFSVMSSEGVSGGCLTPTSGKDGICNITGQGPSGSTNGQPYYSLLQNTPLYTQAPTITSGCGTGATLNSGATARAFQVNIGNPAASTCTLGMPTAPNGWACWGYDISTFVNATAFTKLTGGTASSVVIGNFTGSFASGNWGVGDLIQVLCYPF